MFKRTMFLAFVTFYTTMIAAQNDCQTKFDSNGIYLRYEFWKGVTYVKNGKNRPLGFVYNNLEKEFDQSPAGLPLFKKSQRNLKIATVVSIASMLITAGGAILVVNQINNNGYVLNEHRYRQGINLMVGSAVIGAAVSLPLNYKSRRQLDDALWLRNRDLFQQ